MRHKLHVLIDYQKLKRRRKLYTGGAGPYVAKLFLGRPIWRIAVADYQQITSGLCRRFDIGSLDGQFVT